MPKSIETAANIVLHRGKSGEVQQRRVRKDGWTVRKRAVFLDHLAANANVTYAAEAAGIKPCNAYSLRRRDADFADMWDHALEAGYAALEAMLIERARGIVDVPIGETQVPSAAQMDSELALRLLQQRRRAGSAPHRIGGPPRRRATEEETNAAIMKKLRALAKRLGVQTK